jgi:hypothetical protein
MAMTADDTSMIDMLASLIERWAETRQHSAPWCGDSDEQLWAAQREVVDLLSRAQRLMIEEAMRHADRVADYDRNLRARAIAASRVPA